MRLSDHPRSLVEVQCVPEHHQPLHDGAFGTRRAKQQLQEERMHSSFKIFAYLWIWKSQAETTAQRKYRYAEFPYALEFTFSL